MGKVFLLLAAGFLLLFSQPAYAGDCQWIVQGNVKVLDDLFSDGATLPLAGAEVKVWASVLENGGFALWGSDRISADGSYKILATPALSGPLWCHASRRIKVVVHFNNANVRINKGLGLPQKYNISDKKKWRAGLIINLDYTFKTLTDKKRKQLAGKYVATRSAQLFLGFKKIYSFLERNNLDPNQFRILWPSEAGSKTVPRMWSPPFGEIVIPKSEFWSLNRETDSWSFVAASKIKAKDILHEALHQWFHKHAYVPNYLSGASLNTHDFLESPELSFYEALPEVLAVALDDDIFGYPGVSSPTPKHYSQIREAFATAKKTNSGKKYFTKNELSDMISQNSAEWKKYLARAEFTVKNWLDLLLRISWYKFNPNEQLLAGYGTIDPYDLQDHFDCTEVPAFHFTPVEILTALKDWKSKRNDIIPVEERGIYGFMNWLAESSPDFYKWKNLTLKLGNPHHKDKIWGWTACHAQPLSVPKNPDAPDILIL